MLKEPYIPYIDMGDSRNYKCTVCGKVINGKCMDAHNQLHLEKSKAQNLNPNNPSRPTLPQEHKVLNHSNQPNFEANPQLESNKDPSSRPSSTTNRPNYIEQDNHDLNSNKSKSYMKGNYIPTNTNLTRPVQQPSSTSFSALNRDEPISDPQPAKRYGAVISKMASPITQPPISTNHYIPKYNPFFVNNDPNYARQLIDATPSNNETRQKEIINASKEQKPIYAATLVTKVTPHNTDAITNQFFVNNEHKSNYVRPRSDATPSNNETRQADTTQTSKEHKITHAATPISKLTNPISDPKVGPIEKPSSQKKVNPEDEQPRKHSDDVEIIDSLASNKVIAKKSATDVKLPAKRQRESSHSISEMIKRTKQIESYMTSIFMILSIKHRITAHRAFRKMKN